jgi:hypothetical protein
VLRCHTCFSTSGLWVGSTGAQQGNVLGTPTQACVLKEAAALGPPCTTHGIFSALARNNAQLSDVKTSIHKEASRVTRSLLLRM